MGKLNQKQRIGLLIAGLVLIIIAVTTVFFMQKSHQSAQKLESSKQEASSKAQNKKSSKSSSSAAISTKDHPEKKNTNESEKDKMTENSSQTSSKNPSETSAKPAAQKSSAPEAKTNQTISYGKITWESASAYFKDQNFNLLNSGQSDGPNKQELGFDCIFNWRDKKGNACSFFHVTSIKMATDSTGIKGQGVKNGDWVFEQNNGTTEKIVTDLNQLTNHK